MSSKKKLLFIVSIRIRVLLTSQKCSICLKWIALDLNSRGVNTLALSRMNNWINRTLSNRFLGQSVSSDNQTIKIGQTGGLQEARIVSIKINRLESIRQMDCQTECTSPLNSSTWTDSRTQAFYYALHNGVGLLRFIFVTLL